MVVQYDQSETDREDIVGALRSQESPYLFEGFGMSKLLLSRWYRVRGRRWYRRVDRGWCVVKPEGLHRL